jgi:CRISPR/Cas system CSM-associated protein Csm3 (group 7 of RAMP superfamily)
MNWKRKEAEMSKQIVSFGIKLVTKEPFRIGAQQNVMSGVDSPVTTVGGRVVIQGSSLKGALRAQIEDHLIDHYPNEPSMKPCIPSSYNTLSPEERKLIEMGKYREGGGCSYSPNPKNRTESICPVCYLLGAQGLVGFVRVPYLYTDVPPEDMYAVRIDRASGVVSERTNRDFQIMADGIEFTGELDVILKDTVKGWELGKIRMIDEKFSIGANDRWLRDGKWDEQRIIRELIEERLRAINLLGGFKSRGCGKVEIKVTRIQP